ncbi:MAG: BamA/TamA family outer membrane protein [Candidatus Latescibacteria bacterium]|nr:BamA/TamA family outer membrane protein [Candidatus Latescibacterota bacterium]
MREFLLALALLTLGGQAWGQEQLLTQRDAEGLRIDRIGFRHLLHKPILNRELRSAMLSREGEKFARRFYRGDLATLTKLYRGDGYMGMEVVRSLIVAKDGGLDITIVIDSQELWTVGQVGVQLVFGPLPAPPGELVAVEGYRESLTEDGRLHIELVQGDSAATALAQQRLALLGYGGLAVFDQVLQVRAGDPMRYDQVLQGERETQAWLNSLGYAQARVRNDLQLDARRRTGELVYWLEPGRKMYFGEVEIKGGAEGQELELHTRLSLIKDQLAFGKGDLYSLDKLGRSRTNLVGTNLFRAVTLKTPAVTGDSLQPVEIRLQERKYINAGAHFQLNNTDPRVFGNLLHRNWLGRGLEIGFNGSWGKPLQGGNLFLSQRDLFDTGIDLTVSGGIEDEWRDTEEFADPEDQLQFDLLTANDSILNGLLLFAGESDAATFISSSTYDYNLVERLWQYESTFSKTFNASRSATAYHTYLTVAWRQSRIRPVGSKIRYNAPETDAPIDDGSDDPFGDDPFGDDPFGDDPFGDDPFGDDPFGDDPFGDDPFGDGAAGKNSALAKYLQEGNIDYSDGIIPLDAVWRQILTVPSKTIDFKLGLERDTRDSRIAPSRGVYMRTRGLYALQIGGEATRVLEGDFEVRYYRPLGRHLVWAQALRLVQVASMRKNRSLPPTYWKSFGGEGSVRGVERLSIKAVGGGRSGGNLRSELRLRWKDAGLVLFWDRAGVWRHTKDISWASMVDGLGFGLRYTAGIPFRFDLGWGADSSSPNFYFSIGQAF